MPRKKIAIVTSGHSPFDDRIYWRFAVTLNEHNYETKIFASTEDLLTSFNGIQIHSFDGNQISKREKLNNFLTLIRDFKPDTIICCEPLTIIVANKYRRSVKKNIKIISDITEYYPHQNLLKDYTGLKKILYFLKYFIFNVYTTNLADALIIGELRKAKLYYWIAPLKKKYIIGYYAPKRFFQFSHKELVSPITLCYTGEISPERGIERYIEVLSCVSSRNPETLFKVLIIGKTREGYDFSSSLIRISSLKNVSVEYIDWIQYNEYGEKLSEAHFFLDLREKNKLFDRSLPIKIYDYMACGRPVIFSELNSLKDFPEIKHFTHLMSPDDISGIVEILEEYLNNRSLFKRHSVLARELFEKNYNWESVENIFLERIS